MDLATCNYSQAEEFMNKRTVDKFEIGTPEYIVAHAAWQKARGRGPSESYKGITNPQQALALARKEMPKRPVPDKQNKHQPFRVVKADPFQDERRPKPVAPVQPSLDVRAADNKRIEETLIAVFKAAIAHSNGRLVMVCGEKGGSDLHLMSADDFLELDGKRLGRDFIYYKVFAEIKRWCFLLPCIFNEIILPLKHPLPESYAAAAPLLCKLGETVYRAELLPAWRDQF